MPGYSELLDFITTGDVVTYRGELYKVVKVNPSNYRCEDQEGKIWNLRRTSSVKKAPEGTVFTSRLPDLKEGMAVRFTDSGHRFPGVYIITGLDGGMAKFVKLGGGGRVKGPISGVKPVDAINDADWS
jgi:hypothetical protein